MQCTALQEFEADFIDELSFEMDDILIALEHVDSNWYLVRFIIFRAISKVMTKREYFLKCM